MQHSFALMLLSLRFDYSLSCLLHCSDTGIYSYEYLPETYGGGREGLEIANKNGIAQMILACLLVVNM